MRSFFAALYAGVPAFLQTFMESNMESKNGIQYVA